MNARDLIAELLPDATAQFSDDTLLVDLDGWDSLKGVRFILRLEQAAKRELSEDEIETIISVGDVERLLASV
ncbi:MAG: acyl carrier protein [Devosia sp.]